MEDHSISVILGALVCCLAFLMHYGMSISAVTKFDFVSVGPLTDIDKILMGTGDNYNMVELKAVKYDDNYVTSKEGEKNIKYMRNFVQYDEDLSGLMFCPVRPGGPPPTVIMGDVAWEHPSHGKLLPFVEQYLVNGFCVVTLNEMPEFPRDIFAPILKHLHDNTSASLKVGILSSKFNGNYALKYLSEAQRVFFRPATLVTAVISSSPILNTRRLIQRLLEENGVEANNFVRTVLVDILRPNANLYITLRSRNGGETLSYRAKKFVGFMLGYGNRVMDLMDKADASFLRFEIDNDADINNQAEQYLDLHAKFPQERARQEHISFKDLPEKGTNHALEALHFFSTQVTKATAKKRTAKERVMKDGSLLISEKDEITLQRMHSIARKREGGNKGMIGGFTNDMFGKLLGFS